MSYNIFAGITYNLGGYVLAAILIFVASQYNAGQTRERIILAATIPFALQALISLYHSALNAIPILIIAAVLLTSWAIHIRKRQSIKDEM